MHVATINPKLRNDSVLFLQAGARKYAEISSSQMITDAILLILFCAHGFTSAMALTDKRHLPIFIRPATAADIQMLYEFERGIISSERPFDDSLREGEIHYYDLLELIASDCAEVLVAEINSEVVGSGYAKILEAKPYQKYSPYAFLGFMYVRPDYRGQGVIQEILEHLVIWAGARGVSEVRLDVYAENVSAQKAYTKFGFRPSMLEMRFNANWQHGG